VMNCDTEANVHMPTLCRYTAYPLIFGGATTAILVLGPRDFWPAVPLVVAVALLSVALLERVQPYRRAWNQDHGDTMTDVVHNIVNLALMAAAVTGLALLDESRGFLRGWPDSWPIGLQVLLAGTVLDVSLYAMHRLSHHAQPLWRLHTPHHSPRRLYFLNGERRHPLSAVVLAAPGLAILAALGAEPLAVQLWFAVLTVHLAFQHANIDYSLGPFAGLLGVAETHRWHHLRALETSQVNFGEFWMLWDHLGGTYHGGTEADDELGLREDDVPPEYLAQLSYPFRTTSG